MSDSLFKFLVLFFILVKHSTANYPSDSKNPKPCSQRNYTVRFQGPLCVPNAQSTFTEESNKHCIETLKGECPEFNEAECTWVTINCGNMCLQFPACHLKYKARTKTISSKTTWMEVFYVNQLGTQFPGFSEQHGNASFWPIVEIHRKVLEHDGFPQSDQGDWPNNVPDKMGLQGLHWEPIVFDNNHPEPIIRQQEDVCKYLTDYLQNCGKELKAIFVQLYKDKKISNSYGEHADAIAECIYSPVPDNKNIIYGHLKAKGNYVCDVRFQMTIKVEGKPDFVQDVARAQAYYDYDAKKFIYRKTTLGGNSILRDGTLRPQ